MKKLYGAIICLISISMLAACADSSQKIEYKVYMKPVYKSFDDVKAETKAGKPKTMQNPGKIYVYNNYLFVNESKKGVHVIDNSNPAAPQFILFINIPGNVDIAVKDNILYADSYKHLVLFDISNPAQAVRIKHINNVFECPRFYYDDAYKKLWEKKSEYGVILSERIDPDAGIITDWKQVGLQEYTPDPNPVRIQASNSSSGSTGQAGSMSRFAIYDNYFYCIDSYNMYVYNISDGNNPQFVKELYIGWGIETLFQTGTDLYVGAENGMYIIDLTDPADPRNPVYVSHFVAKDPVVVQDNFAYVTLQEWDTTGTLIIFYVADKENVFEINEMDLENPYGLAVQGTTLFICDGTAGLKIFDISNLFEIKLTTELRDKHAYDIILTPRNVAIVVGADNITQYDISNAASITMLSTITVEKTD